MSSVFGFYSTTFLLILQMPFCDSTTTIYPNIHIHSWKQKLSGQMDTQITHYRISSIYSSWTVDSPSIKMYGTFDNTKCCVIYDFDVCVTVPWWSIGGNRHRLLVKSTNNVLDNGHVSKYIIYRTYFFITY